LIAVGLLLAEGLEADGLQGRRDPGHDLARRRRLLVADLLDDLRVPAGDERGAAGEDLVEDGAQAIDVGPPVDLVLPAPGLLGGHVGRRAERLAAHAPLRAGPRFGDAFRARAAG